MTDIRNTVEAGAQKRVEHSRRILTLAQQLVQEGRISFASYTEIAKTVGSGYPTIAQEALERALSQRILEDELPHPIHTPKEVFHGSLC